MRHQVKLTLLVLAMGLTSVAQAGGSLHTEDNEQVCQMNDFNETKLFVDIDSDADQNTGVLGSKILEMPTKNAFGNNNKLFQVKLVSVSRAKCPNCREVQTILYTSDGVDDIINKLETTATGATWTRNVNMDGVPQNPSFVDTGSCTANEPE